MTRSAYDECLLNGIPTPRDTAHIAIDDRGLRYGDGLFETMRVNETGIFQRDFHSNRLQNGADALHIPLDAAAVLEDAEAWLMLQLDSPALLRIAITRGSGGRGYQPPEICNPTIIAECFPLTAPHTESARLKLSSFTKIPATCLPPHIKHANGLNSVLTRQEATSAGYDEALQLSLEGDISEVSSGNIFWMTGNQLYTPALACDCLEGSIRHLILQNPILPVSEVKAPLAELTHADTVAISNCSWGLWPVSEIETLPKQFVPALWLPLQEWLNDQMRGYV